MIEKQLIYTLDLENIISEFMTMDNFTRQEYHICQKDYFLPSGIGEALSNILTRLKVL